MFTFSMEEMKVNEDLIKVLHRGKSLYGHFSHLAAKKDGKNTERSIKYSTEIFSRVKRLQICK